MLCAICLERAHNAAKRYPTDGVPTVSPADIPEAITIAYGGDALCGDCLNEYREFMEARSDENARFLGRSPIKFEIIDPTDLLASEAADR